MKSAPLQRHDDLVLVSTGQLMNMMRSMMIEVVSETVPPMLKGASRKDLLTTKEAAALLGVSSRTLQNLRDTRQIAFSQHGRKILFKRESVEEFINTCLVNPKSKPYKFNKNG